MLGNTQENTSELKNKISNSDSIYFNKELLNEIDSDLSIGHYGFIDHIMIYKDETLIFDRGYNQSYDVISESYDTIGNQYNYYSPKWHPYLDKSNLHTLQSATKSITSLLIGILIEKGYLEGLNLKILPILGFERTNTLKDDITIMDLLTMRGGIKWDESTVPYTNELNNCAEMERLENWVDYILSQPMESVPGQDFNYNGGLTVLLGKIIEIKSGMRLDKFAEKYLFHPLGIKKYFWKRSPSGEYDTEGGLYLTIHDFAKFGFLIKNNGEFRGKQIVSKNWIKRSLSSISTVDQYHSYGFQWWIFNFENPKCEIKFAGGYGDQFIFWNKKKNILIIIMGWNIFKNKVKYTIRYDLPLLIYENLDK
ncbi:MAG: hypothetical protein Wins2KO_12940 [Winogradskyella sp.]